MIQSRGICKPSTRRKGDNTPGAGGVHHPPTHPHRRAADAPVVEGLGRPAPPLWRPPRLGMFRATTPLVVVKWQTVANGPHRGGGVGGRGGKGGGGGRERWRRRGCTCRAREALVGEHRRVGAIQRSPLVQHDCAASVVWGRVGGPR